MSTERKVYRTIIKVEVLSPDVPFRLDGESGLQEVNWFISDGEGIGDFNEESITEVPPNAVRAALMNLGNDGSFFDEDPYGDLERSEVE